MKECWPSHTLSGRCWRHSVVQWCCCQGLGQPWSALSGLPCTASLATYPWDSASYTPGGPSSVDAFLPAPPHPHFVQLGSPLLASRPHPCLDGPAAPFTSPVVPLCTTAERGWVCVLVDLESCCTAAACRAHSSGCSASRLGGPWDTLESAQTTLPAALSPEERLKFCKGTKLE